MVVRKYIKIKDTLPFHLLQGRPQSIFNISRSHYWLKAQAIGRIQNIVLSIPARKHLSDPIIFFRSSITVTVSMANPIIHPRSVV